MSKVAITVEVAVTGPVQLRHSLLTKFENLPRQWRVHGVLMVFFSVNFVVMAVNAVAVLVVVNNYLLQTLPDAIVAFLWVSRVECKAKLNFSSSLGFIGANLGL